MKISLLLVCLIASAYLTTVASAQCSNIDIVSYPSPVGTVTHGGQTYLKLPDGKVGEQYSVVFSTTGSSHPDNMTWKIREGSPPTGLGASPPPGVESRTLTLSGIPREEGTFYFMVDVRETIPDGTTYCSKRYAITIQPSETQPPVERINYNMDVDVGAVNTVEIDLTPLALGLGGVSKSDNYVLRLKKLSGDSEMIRLEQEGLPQGVVMRIADNIVEAPESLVLENLFLDGEVALPMSFYVGSTGNWMSLAGPGGARRYHLVTMRGRSQSGVARTDAFYLVFYYSLPRLKVFNLKPLTQHGSTLIALKQTIFSFDYTLEWNSPIQVAYRLDLGPKRMWMSRYDVPLREENGHLVYCGTITLRPTDEPRRVYLMENMTTGFLPRPFVFWINEWNNISVNIIDPSGRIRWSEGSVLTASGSFTCMQEPFPYCYTIKVLLFEVMISEHSYYGFSTERISEYSNLNPAGRARPYSVYFGGIFKDNFCVDVISSDRIYRDYVGWRSADKLAEEAADEGYDRVIAIVPRGSLGKYLGVVYHAVSNGVEYPSWDQGYLTAFVDFDEAVDPGRYMYFPVVAHELSHTFRFPDIYGGHIIGVPEESVYFDEFNGGVVKVFKERNTWESLPAMMYWNYGMGALTRLNGSWVAYDIMDYAGRGNRSDYWSWASWKTVGNIHTSDPPEGLLISMIIFRNGTVVGRPFQKVYNHSWSWEDPEPGVTGNFSLTLYLRDGRVFKRIPYNISFYYFVDPGGSVLGDAVPFVRLVDWADDLGRIELADSEGRIWFARSVSANTPVLEILYPPEGKKLGIGRNYTLAWRGTDADGDTLWYTVLIRREGDEVWRSLASRITNNSICLDSKSIKLVGSDFPEGSYEIQIKATDGVNTAVKVIRVQIVKQEQIKTYTLTVGSNIGLGVNGSGTYEEGDMVRVKAPVEEPMKGFIGMLGGKYWFNRWTGAVESKDSEVVVQMTGEQTVLTLTAIYDENYTQVFLILGIIIIVVLAIVVLVALKLGRKPKPPPPPPPPSS